MRDACLCSSILCLSLLLWSNKLTVSVGLTLDLGVFTSYFIIGIQIKHVQLSSPSYYYRRVPTLNTQLLYLTHCILNVYAHIFPDFYTVQPNQCHVVVHSAAVATTMPCCFHGRVPKDEEEDHISIPLPMSAAASAQSMTMSTTSSSTLPSGSGFTSSLNVSDMSAESMQRLQQYPSFADRPTNLRVFSYSDLRNATRNLSRSLMVGEGGFGSVYRGTINTSPQETTEIAVKHLNRNGLQGHKEWLTEVNVLGIVDHPNLVKLIGYCAEDDERGAQRLLVYEFMPNRSVDDHLSGRALGTTLSWPMRLKVALDAARGLKYLHEDMDFQIIFRDLKTSNILLDANWDAKLSDFGMARQGPTEGLTHVSTAVVGTLGYAAPEYLQTGRLTAKSDIWSYGVLLYELITGRRPIDQNRPRGEQKLLDWVKPYISDANKLKLVVDPRLEGHYNIRSVAKLATVANRCLARLPKARPRMGEVLDMVQKAVDVDGGAGGAPLHYYNCTEEGKQQQQQTRKGLWVLLATLKRR